MSTTERIRPTLGVRLALAAGGAAVAAVFGMGGIAVAVADVQASGGAGTTVDTDGTQGDIKPAVQGNQDSDGDQDAYAYGSTIAVPQFKAAH